MSILRAIRGSISCGACEKAILLSVSLICASPVGAAETQGATDQLEDIMVTARRITESAQNVPISISVVSAEDLERYSITVDRDILNKIPSVGASGYADSSYIAIRGQFGKGAVVTYQDEVPTVSEGPHATFGIGVGGPAMFYDMENVQVLKGPQGTLFGRNTTGGAILYATKKPTEDFSASVEGEFGNLNYTSVTAVLNTPLGSDNVLLRLAGTWIQRDGYTHVLSEPGHPNGIYSGNLNAWSTRATLSMKPEDGNFRNDLTLQYMVNNNNGGSDIFRAYDPNFLGGYLLYLFPKLPQLLAQQNSYGVRTQIPIGVEQTYDATYLTVTDVLNYKVSDNITLRNIANYQKFIIYSWNTDGDGTIYPIVDAAYNLLSPENLTQMSEEFQVQGKSFHDDLTWVAGAFLLDAPPPTDFYDRQSYFLGGQSITQWRSGNDSKALYAQGTYDLSTLLSGLRFTAGFRYTWDHFYDQVRNGIPAIGECPPPLQASLPGADALCTQTGEGSQSAPTWTVGFDYTIVPHTLVYVASRRGYREGGINPGSESLGFGEYGPEHVTDAEIGVKSDWSVGGVKVRTNAAAYHQWYTQIQAQELVGAPGGQFIFVTQNGPNAHISGLEFEGTVQPIKDLELAATFAYLNYDYNFTPLTPPEAASLKNSLSFDRPRYKYTFSGTYHLPIPEPLGDLSMSADWYYQSPTIFALGQASLFDQEGGYGILNLNINWDHIAGRPITASIFVNNAADKVYYMNAYAISEILGTSAINYAPPRLFGIRLKYSWGGEAGKH
jgi:iron complex outermembrane receptor protein